MPIPNLNEVRSALLDELMKAGGVDKRRDIIEKLAKRFQLSVAEREIRDQWGSRTFDHNANLVVSALRKKGLIELPGKSGRGIWKLTPVAIEDSESIAALEVKSAPEATEIALSFLSKHYQFIPQQPIKAVREDNTWLVQVDVGLLHTRIAKIEIDAKTAAILEYTIPPEAL